MFLRVLLSLSDSGSHLAKKRYAYVEFAEPEFIDPALTMDNSLFRGRLIKVTSEWFCFGELALIDTVLYHTVAR
jgi:hypothetical protein